MTIVSDRYIIPWMGDSILTMGLDWGSRIILKYDFNDTLPDEYLVYDRFNTNIMPHVWSVEGTFYPTVTICLPFHLLSKRPMPK